MLQRGQKTISELEMVQQHNCLAVTGPGRVPRQVAQDLSADWALVSLADMVDKAHLTRFLRVGN